jgi:Gas vesicle protein
VHLGLRTSSEDCSVIEILDLILDKGIVFEPWIKIALASTELNAIGGRFVVAPERRRKPFIVPDTRARVAKFRS